MFFNSDVTGALRAQQFRSVMKILNAFSNPFPSSLRAIKYSACNRNVSLLCNLLSGLPPLPVHRTGSTFRLEKAASYLQLDVSTFEIYCKVIHFFDDTFLKQYSLNNEC